ncbi:MAG: NADH-quinone oxidoreductase subunit L [Candidatus Krumholzibacteria bacterium]|nr:NADH-quinone oxidoreductase subunit L [Candidatus Krumholzibacteria bacterium]MDH4336596.1 NADH-quinone oxidoreductase subunit L [Candidatus Krumholzibacteria bacterium]MDH5270198.1 NADH-quinone oxidoreductase subunit L [Candidatus Krumholzibacteria bacterium]
MNSLLWIIPIAPLVGAALNGLLALAYGGREKGPSERLVSLIGCAAPLVSFAVVVRLFLAMRGMAPEARIFESTLFTWIAAGPVHIDFAYWVDALSMTMLLVVTGVGSLIHIYSTGYMHGDRGFARFFSYLNLFMFAMLTLVMAKNLPLLFVGWEGVGLCSYLLIGFWYKDIANAAAGKKAFIVNRVGDLAFLIGMFILFMATVNLGQPTLDVPELRALAAVHHEAFGAVAVAACILLFVGACGKSAQIPLYVWLPDAMAGPTPVSALIHAATMVTAGVYMIARLSFLYEMAPAASAVVAVIGAATAIFAASIGFAQRDIKKVLAYSTVSQLGYMFLAVGVGAYAAGVFHLVTHAFFKACLFLGAGSVIHGLSGEQDMFKMGQLRKHMKWTWLTFLVSSLAIAGIPPLAGFFSKDEILWSVFNAHTGPEWLPRVLWVVGLATAGMTAFYIFRAVYLTFYGKDNVSAEAKHHLHESPPAMTVPLMVLAAGAAVVGFLGVPAALGGANVFHHWLEPVFAGHAGGHDMGVGALSHGAVTVAAAAESHGSTTLELILMVVSVVTAVAGILFARTLYVQMPGAAAAFTSRLGGFYTLVFNKYYVDELYERAIVRPGYAISDKLLFRFIDTGIIEGIVNGLGITARLFGATFRLLQSGVVRTYAFFMLIGFLYLVYALVR